MEEVVWFGAVWAMCLRVVVVVVVGGGSCWIVAGFFATPPHRVRRCVCPQVALYVDPQGQKHAYSAVCKHMGCLVHVSTLTQQQAPSIASYQGQLWASGPKCHALNQC